MEYLTLDQTTLGHDFADDVAKLVELRGRIQALEEQAKQVREKIQAAMLDTGTIAVAVDGYRVKVRVQESRRIIADRLVAQGVPPDVIKQATDVTTYTVLDVRRGE